MAKTKEEKGIEVGDFIIYKGHFLAVVATDSEKNICYALCHDNQKMARFDLDADGVTYLKNGCASLVKAIYDDMSLYKRNHEHEFK